MRALTTPGWKQITDNTLCACVCLFVFVFQGIQFLLENDLLQHTPEDIAQFLYKGEGLNKTVIGDYLGERSVLASFTPPCFLFLSSIILFWTAQTWALILRK